MPSHPRVVAAAAKPRGPSALIQLTFARLMGLQLTEAATDCGSVNSKERNSNDHLMLLRMKQSSRGQRLRFQKTKARDPQVESRSFHHLSGRWRVLPGFLLVGHSGDGCHWSVLFRARSPGLAVRNGSIGRFSF
ncbi:uncharacterized protein BJX67DRAFT_230315 [Aspergillus lucknowensis]|uniref:Uncharacterized protein n=1 Tax=Aspergillus lucknowensis TaxID=176173 RepID=A0ABR4LHD5_9EURO